MMKNICGIKSITMKKIFILLLVAITANVFGQKKKTAAPSIDVNKLMKMSPAELEAYKKKMIKETSEQAAAYADENKLNINKAALPGLELKPPVKDMKRLSLIPSRPPTKTELVNNIQQSIQQIQKGMPAPKVEAVTQTLNSLPVERINTKAALEFYDGDQRSAMLLMMNLATKVPDSVLYLNNLAAMYNMSGVMHKAVPLLQYGLEKYPQSSILLGNIGQSYLLLGDMAKAAGYFTQCLAVDSLHVEANHSMGMIHYFNNEFGKAKACFARELSICVRKSTLAMAKRMGTKFNLLDLLKQKNKRNSVPEENAIEEIALNKFSLPAFPNSTRDYVLSKFRYEQFAASVQAEQLFWMNKANQISLGYKNAAGDEYPGLYTDYVNELLDELGEKYTPEYLSNYGQQEFDALMQTMQIRTQQLITVQCPPAPAGSSLEIQEAYAIQCCEEQMRPLADALLTEIATTVVPVFKTGILRWREYVNQLTAIAKLDPGNGNRMMVYNAVAGYFAYLSNAMLYYNGNLDNYLPNCRHNYNKNQIGNLIESNRLWDLNCAPWMNMEAEILSVAVKLDCNKFAIEAGDHLAGAFEYEFKTQHSTLLLGQAFKGSFLGVNGEAKEQLFLTFDGNLNFSDFGIKRTLEAGISGTPIPYIGDKVKIGGNIAGVEISTKTGINSGYGPVEVEWKGAAAWYVDWLKH
jgi:tetratricopeptide (TPR) repeat protein